MKTILREIETHTRPEGVAARLRGTPGLVLLRTGSFDSPQARYSFVTARPFLTLRSAGSCCELDSDAGNFTLFGNPWRVLERLMSRYELLDELDLPFPLGGCFGFWGYDLKNFVEPRLTRRAVNDLELPDCQVGFYDSLVVFDHQLDRAWVVSTGLQADGSRSEARAEEQAEFWIRVVSANDDVAAHTARHQESFGGSGPLHEPGSSGRQSAPSEMGAKSEPTDVGCYDSRRLPPGPVTREQFVEMVRTAQRYIRAGDIYQVNLSHRLSARTPASGWDFYERLSEVSPAPFSAYLDCGGMEIISSSPELFLRLSGQGILTRPIKGTRPRSSDPTRDAQLTYELQTSPKELAELLMITDLLRNDLGRVCEYGSVQVPELARLERFPQVQHLVSTVQGRLRAEVTHFAALAECFPGGSITGAPKIRAMEIIDELEAVTRGPYTGCIGYLGFNRESQLNIAIRTAVQKQDHIYFHAGAGIVADSVPEHEYAETLAKAGGFVAALQSLKEKAVGPKTVAAT